MKLKTSFEFDSAHRLVGYQGKCNAVHGHRWVVEVEVNGFISDMNDIGIIWDFSNTKKIKELFDHKILLKECEENEELIKACLNIQKESVIVMTNNPTAEHLSKLIYSILKEENKKLSFKVIVYESPKNSCEEKC